MQEIARERLTTRFRGDIEPKVNIWLYNDADDMIYRDYGDGEPVAEMSYEVLRMGAQGINEINRVRSAAMRQMLTFSRNKERQDNE